MRFFYCKLRLSSPIFFQHKREIKLYFWTHFFRVLYRIKLTISVISDMFRKDLSERNPEAHLVISGFMSGESKFSSGAVDFVQNNLFVWIINFDQHSQSSISISDNSDCHRDELRVIFSRHHGFLRHFFNKTSSFLKIEIVLKLYIN